ncbi:hypothetical protein [Candidatus Nitrospira bockiana]
MTATFTIINVSGPYREPREPVLSYDFAVQRPHWPTAHAIRIKVSIPDELDYCRTKILDVGGGTPGQQLIMTQCLSRRIADQKLAIADQEGMFTERVDLLVEPFTGPLQHLFPRLETWMRENKDRLRQELIEKARLKPS